tara:strand:+ start:6675 stop:7211 length:537 start_codon:yes stop_codon:yes gene_type:complete
MSILINLLTISRIFLGLLIFLLLAFESGYLLALFLFIFAGLTDYFDGYLARKYKLVSEVGEILDPIADKILIIFIFIGLSVTFKSYLMGFLASVIISREIFVSALRDYNSRKNNNDATKVTFLAKIKTTAQLNTIFIYLIGLAFNINLFFVIGDIFLILSTIITIYTGISYTIATLEE